MPVYFYKDEPSLRAANLLPAHPIKAPLPPAATTLGALARVYNTVGGLIDTLAAMTAIEPMAVLAVWLVESGGRGFAPGKPILRFENHKFWRYWGKDNAALFDAHFRFGGHGATVGKPSQNHLFRADAQHDWHSFHGLQTTEYEVFEFATLIASKDWACMSASFGGPQIMGFNHDACGYADASALFDAFAADARWQVLGFFDFCRTSALIHEIRDHHWIDFGQRHNGDGGVYGPKLAAVHAQKQAFDQLPR